MENAMGKLNLAVNSAFVYPTSKIKHDKSISSKTKLGPLLKLSTHISTTFKKCNPDFRPVNKLPRRILTQPSEGVLNNGFDNEESNLICRVHDVLECIDAKYTILDLLGTGTFGQVFRCQKNETKEVVAVKVIKNKPAYHAQGQLEAKIARLLNHKFDPNDERHIVRLQDFFECKGHICLVFELLSMSLLDVLTQNQFRGLPLNVVQRFARQILSALVTFQEAEVIHCDLKPENILLAPSSTRRLSTSAAVATSDDVIANSSSLSSSSSKYPNNTTISSSIANSTSGQFLSQMLEKTQLASVPESSTLPLHVHTSSISNNISHQPCMTSPLSPEINGLSSPNNNYNNNSSGSATGGSSINPNTRTAMCSEVKVIDLGSACFEGQTMYSYIQSRFYRSPEVLLGVPYNGAIDMWSMACVCAEMYLGLPLFPGVSQHNQLTRIIEMFGPPPDYLVDGKNGLKYFTYIGNSQPHQSQHSNFNNPLQGVNPQHTGNNTQSSTNNTMDDDDFELSRQQTVEHRPIKLSNSHSNSSHVLSTMSQTPSSTATTTTATTTATSTTTSNIAPNTLKKPSKYRLKTAEEYARETKTEIPMLRKYLRYNRLEDVILKYPLANKSKMTNEQKREEILRRHCFLNFLQGLFTIDPFQRWTAKQAANHPFITNNFYTGPYIPSIDPKINDRKLAYLLQVQNRRASLSGNITTGVPGASFVTSGGLNNSASYTNIMSGNYKNIVGPYAMVKHMYMKPSPPPLTSTMALSNIQSTSPQHFETTTFRMLERRQTEPVYIKGGSNDNTNESNSPKPTLSKQSYSTTIIDEMNDFDKRPMLQRGKPVIPEKFSEHSEDGNITVTNMSDGSISDTSIVIIHPGSKSSHTLPSKSMHKVMTSGEHGIAYTPTETSHMNIDIQAHHLQQQQQQLQQQQQQQQLLLSKHQPTWKSSDNISHNSHLSNNMQYNTHRNTLQKSINPNDMSVGGTSVVTSFNTTTTVEDDQSYIAGSLPSYQPPPQLALHMHQQQQQQQQIGQNQNTHNSHLIASSLPASLNNNLPRHHSWSYSNMQYQTIAGNATTMNMNTQQQQQQQQQMMHAMNTNTTLNISNHSSSGLNTSTHNTNIHVPMPPSLHHANSTSNIGKTTDNISPPNIYVGSLPNSNQAPAISDFGQALLRPEIDENRYLRSQQYIQQQQQQQQYAYQLQQQQQQQQQLLSSLLNNTNNNSNTNNINTTTNTLNSLNSSNHGSRERIFSGAAATVMVNNSPLTNTQRQKFAVARSYESKSKNFISTMMGGFRTRNSSGNLGGMMTHHEDDLNQSRHGENEKYTCITTTNMSTNDPMQIQAYHNHNLSPLSNRNSLEEQEKFEKLMNMSTHSTHSIDRSRHRMDLLNMSTHSDRYLNMSTHSVSSIGSIDFPIVNRNDVAVELERQRLGDKEGFMRNQMNEVETHSHVQQQQQQQPQPPFWSLNQFRYRGNNEGKNYLENTGQYYGQQQPPRMNNNNTQMYGMTQQQLFQHQMMTQQQLQQQQQQLQQQQQQRIAQMNATSSSSVNNNTTIITNTTQNQNIYNQNLVQNTSNMNTNTNNTNTTHGMYNTTMNNSSTSYNMQGSNMPVQNQLISNPLQPQYNNTTNMYSQSYNMTNNNSNNSNQVNISNSIPFSSSASSSTAQYTSGVSVSYQQSSYQTNDTSKVTFAPYNQYHTPNSTSTINATHTNALPNMIVSKPSSTSPNHNIDSMHVNIDTYSNTNSPILGDSHSSHANSLNNTLHDSKGIHMRQKALSPQQDPDSDPFFASDII